MFTEGWVRSCLGTVTGLPLEGKSEDDSASLRYWGPNRAGGEQLVQIHAFKGRTHG